MWPFKKKRPEQWDAPRTYIIQFRGQPPMRAETEYDLMALHREAVERKDPLLTVRDGGGNATFQCRIEGIDIIVDMGFIKEEEKTNARKKQLQP